LAPLGVARMYQWLQYGELLLLRRQRRERLEGSEEE
jgi:hypothetical protein